jgi:hypothetical protein
VPRLLALRGRVPEAGVVGIDNISGDTNLDYKAEIDQAAADGMSWLWWSWKNGTVECPVSGSACVSPT